MPAKTHDIPSLENLVEGEDLGLQVLHPGGLEITRELAELCHVGKDTRLLDVASGTGESACFLASELGCDAVGVDASESMVERATLKAAHSGVRATFQRGDAEELPFANGTFDAVISECTTCILDKARAIAEMARVARPGGYVGIHDICWRDDTPDELKRQLAELEGERPETLSGWMELFRRSGLVEVRGVDESRVIPQWTREVRSSLGVLGQVKLVVKVLRRWGIRGYRNIAESERVFSSPHTGYGIVVGRKPS